MIILGVNLNKNVIETCTEIQEWMMVEDIRHANLEDDHTYALSTYVIHYWLSTRSELLKEVQPYLSFRDNEAAIDRNEMKDRWRIVPTSLQITALDELHVNHKNVEKTRLLTYVTIYWINTNADLENVIKIAPYVLIFR